jgi:oxygen-independent coproporphyrinogen III oxidase
VRNAAIRGARPWRAPSLSGAPVGAKPHLLAYATRSVPRYTSYPTAPHFTDSLDCHLYSAWLEAVPAAATLSLYLHVPYCRAICHYCGCHTKAARRDETIAAYAGALRRELDLVVERLGTGRPLIHLHWGGGTPSILAERDFLALVQRIGAGFGLTSRAEHAIELDPRAVDVDLVARLRRAGINRASLGVQDFDPAVQEAIGRVQPFEAVARAVSLLREAGIERIGFDLMYGLPRQTVEGAERTAAMAAGLAPERIALFGYAHVPWLKKHQRLIDERDLANAMERFGQAQAAARVLERHGYRRIGLDHFALPHGSLARAAAAGRLRRNFQGYTSDPAEVLVGLGASAIGRLPQAYVQNASDIAGWRRALEGGRLPVARGRRLGREDLLRGEIIERLMCDLSVDLGDLANRHALPLSCLSDAFRAMEPLRRKGLLVRRGWRVTVPEPMRPFLRIVASAFDAYLQPSAARHSSAV